MGVATGGFVQAQHRPHPPQANISADGSDTIHFGCLWLVGFGNFGEQRVQAKIDHNVEVFFPLI